MFVSYPNKGKCRFCGKKAVSPKSTICNEHLKEQWKHAARQRYASNLEAGLTTNGYIRQRKHKLKLDYSQLTNN